MSGKKDRYTLKATSQGWSNTAAGGQDHSGPPMSGQHENEMEGQWNAEFSGAAFNAFSKKNKGMSLAQRQAAYKTSKAGASAASTINKPAKKKKK